MSHANMSASFRAIVSDMCASPAAWNSDESIVAVAVRIRVSTGSLIICAVKPSACRTTLSVWVSLTLRISSLISPAVCVRLIASPGLSMSRLWRIPGRSRIAARSDLSSASRRNIPSSVSLRPTTTSIVEAMPAC